MYFSGNTQGELSPQLCFWLSGKQDSIYTFRDDEIKAFDSPLSRTEISSVIEFARKLMPAYRPNIDEIEDMEKILQKLKMGEAKMKSLMVILNMFNT